jgi:hypothetical protein
MPVLPAVPSTMVPPGVSVEDHELGGPILHGHPRVEPLALAEDATPGGLGGAGELDEGGVADGVDDVSADGHGILLRGQS